MTTQSPAPHPDISDEAVLLSTLVDTSAQQLAIHKALAAQAQDQAVALRSTQHELDAIKRELTVLSANTAAINQRGTANYFYARVMITTFMVLFTLFLLSLFVPILFASALRPR